MGGIGLLGPLTVDGGEALERRDRVALSVLALRRGNVVSPDEFAEALWGDHPPSSWPKQVQICIGRLRKVLGPAAIETVPGGYRLAQDGDEVDGVQFEQLIDRARVLRATGEVDRAAASYARALALWRGRPLEELDGWLPGQSEAARLEELRRTAEEDWLDCRLAAGEHREVVAEAQGLVTAEPLRERRWATLALAQYRCGRQGEALRSLSLARRTLVDELGIDPGPDLVSLEDAILRQDVALSEVPEATAASEACPYKGLASYDIGDEETFFGRDAEIAACVERLRSTPLLVVAGPSGCGKSSLVRAGVVPDLRRRELTAVVFVPGTDPDAAMDTAIAEVDGPAILVIDQFEELLALDHPPEVIRRFCRRVAAHATEMAPVIIAVRSDHVGGLGTEPGFSRLAERGMHLVTPLAGDALRESIEQPAELAGLRLEHGLVELLVRDCEGEPGGLPLLSHALAETWRRRDGNVLTVEGYRATGGIRGAVARTADRLYDTLPGDQRTVLRAVLLRLVTPTLDGDPVRCRVSSQSLLGDANRERIVGLLVRARLVTSEEDSFELAHEALARAWPRLQSWLDDDVAGQRLLRHLTSAAEGWESLGRPVTELYRGARLDTALEWRDASEPHLTELEQQFLAASLNQASTETRAIAERARRDASQNRRLRSLLGATAILLVASMIVGYVAIRQREEATSERQVASRERRVATARALAAAADANATVDAERSVLLALAAVEESRAADGSALPEAEEALHRAVTADRIELRVPGVGGELAWSPDGQVFVTEGPQSSGIVDIRDAHSGASVRSFLGHDLDVTGVAFNHDGTLMATTGADGAAKVWDPATGEELHSIEHPGGTGAWGPSFSPEGTYFAAAWPDDHGGVVRVLDLESDRVHEMDSVPSPAATSFDPSGTRLAVASAAEPIAVVLHVDSGEELVTAVGHFAPLNDVAWSPDGATIATAADDGSARLFDAATGQQWAALLGHGAAVESVAWSPESTRLVTAGNDGTVKGWTLIEGAGRELFNLSAHDQQGQVLGVAFSPDGTRVMTGNAGITSTIIWNIGPTGGTEVAGLPAVAFHPGEAEFSADGQRLLTASGGGAIQAWDPETWSIVRTFGAEGPLTPSGIPGVAIGSHQDVRTLEVDPRGQLVASARGVGDPEDGGSGLGGEVEVWEIESGRRAFAVATDGDGSPSWSPDGQLLAVLDRAGSVTIVDRSGDEVTHLDAAGGRLTSAAFIADGERLVTVVQASGPYDPDATRMVIWDWRSGEIEHSIATEAIAAYPSPAGDLIGVQSHWRAGSQDVEMWDARTGQLVSTLTGYSGEVDDIAFSSSGSLVATASFDSTIRVWDARSGELQLVLHGNGAQVSGVSLSPDGSQLASYSVDGVVRIWALDLDDLIEIAQDRLTRSFTEAECQQYLHTERCPEPL